MTDVREQILARILVVLGTVEGVARVARNRPDVPGLSRPAAVLHDGGESERDKGLGGRAVGQQDRRIQVFDLAPIIHLLIGADIADIGGLLSMLRLRILAAILNDSELITLRGRNGEIRYAGCQVDPPGPESREGRMEINLTITYVLRVSDLS